MHDFQTDGDLLYVTVRHLSHFKLYGFFFILTVFFAKLRLVKDERSSQLVLCAQKFCTLIFEIFA